MHPQQHPLAAIRRWSAILRPVAALMLLLPLSLNGLRVVCVEQPDASETTIAAVANGAVQDDCEKLCAYPHPRVDTSSHVQGSSDDDRGSATCQLASNDDARCITGFAFGPARPAVVMGVEMTATAGEAVLTASAFAPSPALTVLTPPPRA